MNFWKIWQKKPKHPFARVFYGYCLFTVVVSVIMVLIPALYNRWVLGLFELPYFIAAAFELFLLLRERRLLARARRFWFLWAYWLPCFLWAHELGREYGWDGPIGLFVCAGLAMPFLHFFGMRMLKLSWV